METIAITGATGFIGRHLLNRLEMRQDAVLLALAHSAPGASMQSSGNLRWLHGDLADDRSLRDLLVPGCTLVHLAFPVHWSHTAHLHATANLAQLVVARKVHRVI